ncbi:MAG: ABC transporter ATP-binding protein/permease [Clostridia bacterium]|nr:ABC transporter ATP-binding protein/permease [Clostridia bacterium]
MSNKTNRHSAGQTFSLLRDFFPYFKPHMKTMAFDLFCAALTTLCDLTLPLIVRYITGAAQTGATLLVSTVLKLGALYVLLRVIDTAANYYMQSIGHIMGARIETEMRRDLFAHLHKLSHSYYDNAKIGQLMSRITSDLNDITEFAHHFPEEMFIATVKIVVAFVILCGSNVLLTVIIFAVLPFMVGFSNYFAQKMRKSFRASRHQLGELNARVEDSLLGIRVVKSFANEELEKEKFAEGNALFLKIKRGMFHNMAGFNSVTRLFDGVMYITVVVLGAIFMIKGKITAPDLIAYLLYVQTLLTSIRRIVEFMEGFQRGLTGIERFGEVMVEPVTIADSENAVELKDVQGRVDFNHVTFRYGENLDNVLTDIDLHVPAGRSIALVGPSGGGKTTLCSLIPRFYEVSDGSITIDGQDIRNFTLHSLRSHIGVVQQDVYMFSGTIAENIEYGCPGASREQIIEAAKMAGAHDFILQLENGYETFVGEHGVRLSGGQKQRISIARVFLKNPPILILDEATSALDNESERLDQDSLNRLMKGRTTFTIAHRLTTIRNADTILVLTEDGIIESGTHEALLAQGGMYADMYHLYDVR